MDTIFGIETEYGIFVEGKGPSDLVAESIDLVSACADPGVAAWDYRAEDPRRDMRGYRVGHLTRDPNDAAYDRPDERPRTMAEERNDRLLANGARLYNDHGHPEYSTPECSALRQLVAHDRAGERILRDCVHRRAGQGVAVTLYKNNSDYHGMSYGCHESYLFPREVPFDRVLSGLLPFFVTRQIFAGAGKVGPEVQPSATPIFQLSQRADFFTVEASVDTLFQRPIFNTRDEPHADPAEFRRLHVICGDANLCEYSTALKVGTTAVVLDLIRRGWQPALAIRNPVATIQNLSRDQSWQWFLTLDDGRSARATDVQDAYLEAATRMLGPDADEDTRWVLDQWSEALSALKKDPLELADRLDWVAKRSLLEQFLKEEGLDWSSELAQSLDLEYHNIDPDQGLYHGLEQAGAVRRLVSDEDIDAARATPPETTRAWVRGEIIRRFPAAVRAGSWGRLLVEQDGQSALVNLEPLAGRLNPVIREQLDQKAELGDWVAGIARVTRAA